MAKVDARRLQLVGQGAEATVYSYRPGRVLKLYTTAKDRDFALHYQARAFELGLAPPTYGPLDTGSRYGYVSARASDFDASYGSRRIRELRRKLNRAGFKVCDVAPRNCGVYDGRDVFLDFGHYSTTKGTWGTCMMGLRNARIARNLTQQDLADKAQLGVRTIWSVEKGKGCRWDTKRKILSALDLPFTPENRSKIFA